LGLVPPFKAIQEPPFVRCINYRWLNIHFPKAVIGFKDINVGLVPLSGPQRCAKNGGFCQGQKRLSFVLNCNHNEPTGDIQACHSKPSLFAGATSCSAQTGHSPPLRDAAAQPVIAAIRASRSICSAKRSVCGQNRPWQFFGQWLLYQGCKCIGTHQWRKADTRFAPHRGLLCGQYCRRGIKRRWRI
jgi:hypothetical protein